MSLNLNDFNTKVNLSKIVEKVAEPNTYFIKSVFPFGEFACNHDFSNVFNVFDLMGTIYNPEQLYTQIINNWPQVLRQPIVWREYSRDKIHKECILQQSWANIVMEAQKEIINHTYVIRKEITTIAKQFEEMGYFGAVINGMGHISQDVINKHSEIAWNNTIINNYRYPVIVPYYHTPNKTHISYIEVFDALDSKLTRKKIYAPNYHGFTGKLTNVLPDFTALMHREGCLWDYTLDYWNNTPLLIDNECGIGTLLTIFKTNKTTKFIIDPLSIIKERNLSSQIYENLHMLSREDITIIQNKLNLQDIYDDWLKIQNYQYLDGRTMYFKSPEGYFMSKYGEDKIYLTNFSLTRKGQELREVGKRKIVFFIIEATMHDKSIILEVPEHVINSKSRLKLFLIKEFHRQNMNPPRYYKRITANLLENFIFDWFECQNA